MTTGPTSREERAEQRREARRQQILDAALDLFSSRGYLDSPIELICQTARVSTKSFYQVFESREACYIGLMERSADHLKSAVARQFDEWDGETDEFAVAGGLLQTLAHAAATDPRHAIVLFGKGSATTAAVEHLRRTNRRWAGEFLTVAWRAILPPPVEIPRGVVVGTVGGLFDIMGDWVADAEDGVGLDDQELRDRFFAFYSIVRAGFSDSTNGKDILSKLL